MTRLLTLIAALLMALPTWAAELGDDGLHKTPWMRDTFKDLTEDLDEATASGKRLLILIEQRGCIYCAKMHQEVFPDPEITAKLQDDFFVVQINMFGDVEVTDFDGTTLPEKDMVRRWGLLFTPTMMFLPEQADSSAQAHQVAVATMPGAFGRLTTLHLLNWVTEKGYEADEPFQKYLSRRIAASEN